MKEFLGNCLMYCQKVQITNFLSQFNKLTALKPTPDFYISLRLLPRLIPLKSAQFWPTKYRFLLNVIGRIQKIQVLLWRYASGEVSKQMKGKGFVFLSACFSWFIQNFLFFFTSYWTGYWKTQKTHKVSKFQFSDFFLAFRVIWVFRYSLWSILG